MCDLEIIMNALRRWRGEWRRQRGRVLGGVRGRLQRGVGAGVAVAAHAPRPQLAPQGYNAKLVLKDRLNCYWAVLGCTMGLDKMLIGVVIIDEVFKIYTTCRQNHLDFRTFGISATAHSMVTIYRRVKI